MASAQPVAPAQSRKLQPSVLSITLSAVAVGISSGTPRRATLSWSTSFATPWAAMSALL